MDWQALDRVLTAPTPAALWELHGQLLAAGAEPAGLALRTAEAFHHYLCEMQGKITARQYSQLASLLDIGAIGGVALQNLVGLERTEVEGQANDLLKKLLLGTAGESLMVLASRQYVKGWQSELNSTHCRAAWYLAEALWALSATLQPGLPSEERNALIGRLLAPARDPKAANETRVVLLGRLFQLVLLSQCLPLLARQPR